MNDIQQTAELIISGKLVDFDPQHIIDTILKPADDAYYNTGEILISDNVYDNLTKIIRSLDALNVYFTGVGSDVRGEKVKLPYEMGSLDQIYEGEIEEWVSKNSLDNEDIITSDKLDGVSAMLVYDGSGKFQIAYSRGNGTEGADISRHVRKIKNVPSNINIDDTKPLAIRGEIIISKKKFKTVVKEVKTRSNKNYKNPRNMVAGLMNAKENLELVYDYVEFIAFDIISSNLSKSDQLQLLQKLKFDVCHYEIMFACELDDKLLISQIENRKKLSDYEIDGVVLDVNNADARQSLNPTRETLNPAYSIKYKLSSLSNSAEAVVDYVQWNISKHGYLKPTVVLKPFEMGGVTIKHATGFNAKFIIDNKVGPGAKVLISRSGDVIPYLNKVIEPSTTETLLPKDENFYPFSWNETGVDFVIDNADSHPEVQIQQAIDFFSSIGVEHLGEGNIRKIFEEHTNPTIIDILTLDQVSWKLLIGENGLKIFESLKTKFNNIPLYKLMGATHFFGRGVGTRKFKKLFRELDGNVINATFDQIVNVDGFEVKTAEKIIKGMEKFNDFYKDLKQINFINVTESLNEGTALKNQKFCFTGFRDANLTAQVESLGATVTSSVSKNTNIVVAKNPTSNSGKAKKAKELNIQIMSIDEFKQFLSEQ